MDYVVVPEGLGHNKHLGIVDEMVHHYQDIFFLTLPQLQVK